MIRLHGYLGTPDADLVRAAAAVDLVVGSRRALAALDVAPERRVELGPLAPALDRLAALDPQREALVLASGDPGFYGILRGLRAAGITCRVTPAPSSVAAAFAAVGLPWDDAQIVSAHGHDLGPAIAAARALPKLAVLTAPGRGAAELAQALPGVARCFVVAECLGEPQERIRILDRDEAAALEDVRDPHVVLVLAAAPDDPAALGTPAAVSGPATGAGPRGGAEAHAVAELILGRYRPGVGDMVWVGGPVGRAVGDLCAQVGAGVAALDDGEPPPAPAPLVAVLDHRGAQLAGGETQAGGSEPAAAAVERVLGYGAPVVVAIHATRPATGPGAAATEHLVLTGPGGDPLDVYLTTIRATERATRSDPTTERPGSEPSPAAGDTRTPVRIGQVLSGAASRARADEIEAVLGCESLRFDGPAREAIPAAWRSCDLVVCHLALGATTRLLAPLLADKRSDPGVVVVDEAGRFVVPLVGGHAGGANELARRLADGLGATAVLTTATDAAGIPGLDTLGWPCRGDVAGVTRAVLDGRPVRLVRDRRCPLPPLPPNVTEEADAEAPRIVVTDTCADPWLAAPAPPSVVLHPPSLVVGMGCNSGTGVAALEDLARATLVEAGLAVESLAALTTVDAKAGEIGLVQLAHRLGVRLVDYPAGELAAHVVPSPSAVVASHVGTPSVAEASVLAHGADLVVPKHRTREATCAVGRLPARGTLFVVGLGPGSRDLLTPMAREAIRGARFVVGYGPYVRQIRDLVRPGAEVLASTMGTEQHRTAAAIARARTGDPVALVCSGDPAVYAMASPVLEQDTEGIDVVVVPGVTAGLAASAILGAPLGHDHALVSLSDLHTEWQAIERRLAAAAAGDLVTVLYNPRSRTRTRHLVRALEIFGEHRPGATPVAVVRQAYRQRQSVTMATLDTFDPGQVDMTSIVVVGSSTTRYVTSAGGEQRMVTPRDYRWLV